MIDFFELLDLTEEEIEQLIEAFDIQDGDEYGS